MAGSHAHGSGDGGGWTCRHEHEAEVYDRRADELLATLSDDEFLLDPVRPPYPNREHVDFLDHALARLGPLRRRRILEVGCGQGSLAVWLGLQGAEVVGIDVSEGNVRLGRRKAHVNGVAEQVRFAATPIELLDEPDATFDAVVGNQVLHHVDLHRAMPNIHRMLRPGGAAVFCEPVLFLPEGARRLRNSRVVTRAFPVRTDTPDERSISLDDLAVMSRYFETHDWRPFQVLCRAQNFLELSDPVFHRLARFDRALLRRMKPAWRLSRYVVSVLGRAEATDPLGATA